MLDDPSSSNSNTLRQSMASLHTWAGLVPGWILFLVFLFGTAAFFNHEISAWMRPELSISPVSDRALKAAEAKLINSASGSEHWFVTMPHPRGGSPLTVAWPPKQNGKQEWGHAAFNSSTGAESAIRDTRGGAFLYDFHYNLHYIPYWLGRYIILIASLSMLVAILSGIITHKKIFADFFMLRFGKGQRSWLDAHNVTSVLALPFHLMITYTGLVIFGYMLMPGVVTANFASEDAYFDTAYPAPEELEASGQTAPTLPLSHFTNAAKLEWGELPSFIAFDNPGDTVSVVTLTPVGNALGPNPQAIYLSAVTGDKLDSPPSPSSASLTNGVLAQLHAGWFAAPVLRWLYFLAGVSGTIMIASGLVLWTVKRRAKLPDSARPHFGFKLVERLNIGVVSGATGGIAVYFLANRLLPLGFANRAEWEIHSLFIAWGAVFVWSLGRPAKRAWIETQAAGAAMYAAVPVINAVTTERGLIPSLVASDWVFVGFDMVMLAMAAMLALAARRITRHKPKVVTRRGSRSPVEASA